MKLENSRNEEIDLEEYVKVEDTHANELSSNFSCVCQASPDIIIT